MKYINLKLGICCGLMAALIFPAMASGMKETEAQQLFVEAGKLYDQLQIPEAIEKYETIVGKGFIDAHVFFNLGNAYFRNGNMGKAMLNYQRALRLKPNDPDINANIEFTLRQAGLPGPETSFWEKFFTQWKPVFWALFSALIYWVGAIVFCVYLFLRISMSIWTRSVLIFSILLCIGIFGLVRSTLIVKQEQVVILSHTVEALYSPLENATPYFSLNEASLAEVVETNADWIKIKHGKERAWIPRSACAFVRLSHNHPTGK